MHMDIWDVFRRTRTPIGQQLQFFHSVSVGIQHDSNIAIFWAGGLVEFQGRYIICQDSKVVLIYFDITLALDKKSDFISSHMQHFFGIVLAGFIFIAHNLEKSRLGIDLGELLVARQEGFAGLTPGEGQLDYRVLVPDHGI